MSAVDGLAAELAAKLRTVEHTQGSLEVSVDGELLTAASGRDLRQVLAGHLYNQWHTRLGDHEDNDTRFYRDLQFESELAQHTPHRTAQRTAALVAAEPGVVEDPDEVIVVLDGVKVGVPRASIVEQRGQSVLLSVPAARPSLSPGFWLVDGSRGRFPSGRPPLRVYLSIDRMEEAPRVWQTALRALEGGGHRYRAKVGSAARLYPRTDACVIYVDASAAPSEGSGPVDALLEAVRGEPGRGVETSVFTHTLAPGVAVATEPVDARPGMAGMSFGQHRCYAVATGILDTDPGQDLGARVRGALLAASVDPLDPAHNTSSTEHNSFSTAAADGDDDGLDRSRP